jgi:hypothetical protein
VSDIAINKGSLTIDEMDLVEQVTGAAFEDIADAKVRGLKVVRAFAVIGLRRMNGTAADEPVTQDELKAAGKVDVQGLEEMLGRPTRPAEPADSSPLVNSRKPRASRSNASQN